MEAQVDRLAQKIIAEAKKKSDGERLLVAIAGPPGSGKSTVVDPLLVRVNQLTGKEDSAICVSLDGWHLYRHELDAISDPKEAHWRRGAAFTFDDKKYLAFVTQLRSSSPSEIPFFLFDHALKDPSPSPTPVLQTHKIIIIEGLYTLLDQPGWREAAMMMDLKVWIEVEKSEARRRLIERNFAAGICGSREETAVRVDASDMANGEMVREYRIEPTDIITSIPHSSA